MQYSKPIMRDTRQRIKRQAMTHALNVLNGNLSLAYAWLGTSQVKTVALYVAIEQLTSALDARAFLLNVGKRRGLINDAE